MNISGKAMGLSVLTLLVGVALSACGSRGGDAVSEGEAGVTASEGCGPVSGSIDLPSEHTDQEDRLGGGSLTFPVAARQPDAAALEALGVPSELRGLPAGGLVADKRNSGPRGEAVVIYSKAEVDGKDMPEIYAEGGLVLNVTPLADAFTSAMMMQKFPGRLVPVAIGSWEGAANWGDPDQLGNRQYGVFWEDESRGYWLSGAGTVEQLVEDARSIACGTA